MIERFFTSGFALVLMSVGVLSSSAQVPDPEACRGPIYSRREVTKPAKMINQPNFKALYAAFGNGVSGRVTLEAVLCRSGRVTDIRVIDSQPPKIGEFVAAALSLVRFKPAELNWHTVSQRQQFEFNFNDYGVSPIDSAAAAGRRVEELDMMGNRRMTAKQIFALIKTRPGDIYSADQVQRDLMAILATGYFNSKGTRVLLDGGVRGGVRVIFEVVELPLIRRLWFRGVTAADEFAIMEELVKPYVNIRIGVPSHPERLKAAMAAIKQYLQSNGWSSVSVESLIENLSATEVNVTFIVTGLKPKI